MLEVNDLAVVHASANSMTLTGPVSFTVADGEIFGLVGESGSGKSMAALALMQLAPRNFRVTGSAMLDGTDLARSSERAMRRIRGRDISMVFQEPVSALNPVFTLESQLVSAIRAHRPVTRAAARSRAVELLKLVGIPDPETRVGYYPHQLSGGMCQRAMIAMALASGARFLIADEPTTALDVTIQEQILQLLERLVRQTGLSVLFISHDLGVVARLCDRVAVLYAGEVVESGDVRTLLRAPRHPYSMGLLRCAPNLSHVGKVQRGIAGSPPAPDAWPGGCRFRDRCPHARDRCHVPQSLRALAPGHEVRCCRAEELALDAVA